MLAKLAKQTLTVLCEAHRRRILLVRLAKVHRARAARRAASEIRHDLLKRHHKVRVVALLLPRFDPVRAVVRHALGNHDGQTGVLVVELTRAAGLAVALPALAVGHWHAGSVELHALELLAGDGELPSEQVEGECLKGDLRDLLSQLPELQGKVLRMRYGMDGEEPMSLTGIAKSMKMSRDRTRRLEREGLEMLRRGDEQLQAYVLV